MRELPGCICSFESIAESLENAEIFRRILQRCPQDDFEASFNQSCHGSMDYLEEDDNDRKLQVLNYIPMSITGHRTVIQTKAEKEKFKKLLEETEKCHVKRMERNQHLLTRDDKKRRTENYRKHPSGQN